MLRKITHSSKRLPLVGRIQDLRNTMGCVYPMRPRRHAPNICARATGYGFTDLGGVNVCLDMRDKEKMHVLVSIFSWTLSVYYVMHIFFWNRWKYFISINNINSLLWYECFFVILQLKSLKCFHHHHLKNSFLNFFYSFYFINHNISKCISN